jgi:hypothetical protein
VAIKIIAKANFILIASQVVSLRIKMEIVWEIISYTKMIWMKLKEI